MKAQFITLLLVCTCFSISHAQEEKSTEAIESKAMTKVKSKPALSSPEKNDRKVQKTNSNSEGPKRTKAIVKESNKELKIEGVPEGVSTENKQSYQDSKAKWIEAHPEEYQEIIKSRKTIIKKDEFDKLSPEQKEIILNNSELYEITE